MASRACLSSEETSAADSPSPMDDSDGGRPACRWMLAMMGEKALCVESASGVGRQGGREAGQQGGSLTGSRQLS